MVILYFVLFFVSAVSQSVAPILAGKYDSMKVNSDDIISPLSEKAIYTRSILECSAICSVSDKCLSILYNKAEKLCRINYNIVIFKIDAAIPYLATALLLVSFEQVRMAIPMYTI